jgi:hypothetical protein
LCAFGMTVLSHNGMSKVWIKGFDVWLAMSFYYSHINHICVYLLLMCVSVIHTLQDTVNLLKYYYLDACHKPCNHGLKFFGVTHWLAALSPWWVKLSGVIDRVK